MSTVGQIERATQDHVVAFLIDKKGLGWNYLGNWQDREENSNIELGILKSILKAKGYSETIINKVIFDFIDVTQFFK